MRTNTTVGRIAKRFAMPYRNRFLRHRLNSTSRPILYIFTFTDLRAALYARSRILRDGCTICTPIGNRQNLSEESVIRYQDLGNKKINLIPLSIRAANNKRAKIFGPNPAAVNRDKTTIYCLYRHIFFNRIR